MTDIDVTQGHFTDLAPTCDRCGQIPQTGGVMNGETLNSICFACLTEDEWAKLLRGEDPFGEDGD